MNVLRLFVLGAAVLAARGAVADQVLQECQIVHKVTADAPRAVHNFVSQNRNSVARVCRQIEFGTQTYFGLGPVRSVDGVCSFTQLQIVPEMPQPPANLQFMLRSDGSCPSHDSKQYIPVHNASEEEFAAIMVLLQQLSTSDDTFTRALNQLPPEQRDSADLMELKHFVMRTGRVPVVRIAKIENLLGIRSVFDVQIETSRDESRFFIFRIRKLFGQLAIVEFAFGST